MRSRWSSRRCSRKCEDTPMKFKVIAAIAVLLVTAAAVFAQVSDAHAFTGVWKLDRTRTDTKWNFPERLKDFVVTVVADGDRLIVKEKMEGDVEVRPADVPRNGSLQ